ncbi:putative phloem protein [Medicago truncatula]|uniref:Phloem protein n=1 Tax=Medicago truncatula TaxID=3880 RepID=A0A072U3G3_MEDTR|nr:F-box protein PP2-B1 [Medicago truncatula]KEH23871.1 phloem protein [Medicago truncatula]RHN48162.1 putative phloem protein [Medicago truncatula]
MQADSPSFLRHSVLPPIQTKSGLVFSSFPARNSWPLSSHSPFLTKKALYLALSHAHHPIIIDHGTKGFYLDRKSGKKCYILAAKSLIIPYGALVAPNTNMPPSRFPEVVEIRNAFSLEIRGRINTLYLSRNTQYVAYLVFQMIDAQRFKNCLMRLSVGVYLGYFWNHV